jgi:hypothetical protein
MQPSPPSNITRTECERLSSGGKVRTTGREGDNKQKEIAIREREDCQRKQDSLALCLFSFAKFARAHTLGLCASRTRLTRGETNETSKPERGRNSDGERMFLCVLLKSWPLYNVARVCATIAICRASN